MLKNITIYKKLNKNSCNQWCCIVKSHYGGSMKRFFVFLLLIMLSQTSVNAFEWGLVNTILSRQAAQATSTSALTAIDIVNTFADIENQAETIDSSVQNSFLTLVSTLSSQEEAQAINSQIASILANTSANEIDKRNLISQIMTSYAASLKNNTSDTASIIRNLSVDDRAALTQVVTSLAQDGQSYLQLGKQGVAAATNAVKVAKKAGDFITVLNDVNRTVANIKNRAQTVIYMTNLVKTISKSAGFVM